MKKSGRDAAFLLYENACFLPHGGMVGTVGIVNPAKTNAGTRTNSDDGQERPDQKHNQSTGLMFQGQRE